MAYWQTPPNRFLKINCDAAWLINSIQVGLGFVVRNLEGQIVLSGAKHVEHSESDLIAEARSVWRAIKFAHEKHLPRIVVETGSLVLYHSLSTGKPLQQISSIWHDIMDLAYIFEGCRWSFFKRDGNAIAHSIARWALENNSPYVVDGLHLESSVLVAADVS